MEKIVSFLRRVDWALEEIAGAILAALSPAVVSAAGLLLGRVHQKFQPLSPSNRTRVAA